jgi:hypothetical protein
MPGSTGAAPAGATGEDHLAGQLPVGDLGRRRARCRPGRSSACGPGRSRRARSRWRADRGPRVARARWLRSTSCLAGEARARCRPPRLQRRRPGRRPDLRSALMLFHVSFRVEHTRLDRDEFWDEWEQETQAALGALETGVIKSLYKVAGQRRVIGIVGGRVARSARPDRHGRPADEPSPDPRGGPPGPGVHGLRRGRAQALAALTPGPRPVGSGPPHRQLQDDDAAGEGAGDDPAEATGDARGEHRGGAAAEQHRVQPVATCSAISSTRSLDLSTLRWGQAPADSWSVRGPRRARRWVQDHPPVVDAAGGGPRRVGRCPSGGARPQV